MRLHRDACVLVTVSSEAFSWRTTAEAALSGFVIILQRNHKPLHRSQRSERDYQDQWEPQDGVHPVRRVINCFRDQGGADDDKTGYEHNKNGRPITGVDEAIVESANFAAGTKGQKSNKQLSPAAMRTAAAQTHLYRFDHLFGHANILQQIPFGLKHFRTHSCNGLH